MEMLGILEGILFVVGSEGINSSKLMSLLNVSEVQLNNLFITLKDEYSNANRGMTIEYLADKYKLVTKKEHKCYYEKLVEVEKSETLSQSALETLAIIAYNGPVTRLYVDEIRGVDSSYLIRKLVFRNLVKDIGRSDLPGRPILYGVTDEFLNYLGLSSINELPKMEEVTVIDNETDLYESKYKE